MPQHPNGPHNFDARRTKSPRACDNTNAPRLNFVFPPVIVPVTSVIRTYTDVSEDYTHVMKDNTRVIKHYVRVNDVNTHVKDANTYVNDVNTPVSVYYAHVRDDNMRVNVHYANVSDDNMYVNVHYAGVSDVNTRVMDVNMRDIKPRVARTRLFSLAKCSYNPPKKEISAHGKQSDATHPSRTPASRP